MIDTSLVNHYDAAKPGDLVLVVKNEHEAYLGICLNKSISPTGQHSIDISVLEDFKKYRSATYKTANSVGKVKKLTKHLLNVFLINQELLQKADGHLTQLKDTYSF
jgi:hypothetical protein